MSNPLDLHLSQTKTFERSLMRNVYTWMAMALMITGLTAYLIAEAGLYRMFTGGIGIVFAIATLAFAWFLPNIIMKVNTTAATLLYALFAVLEGALLSVIFVIYTRSAIYSAFFATAGTFAVMAIYGTVTKKDLSGLSSYLMMGIIGIIIASVVNMFVRSVGFSMLINYAAVLIFTILAAYQTQQLKRMAQQMGGADEVSFFRISLICAFSLYLTFLNLFIRILMIFGRRD